MPLRRLGTVLLAASLPAAILLAQGHDVEVPYVPPPRTNTQLQDPVTKLARRVEAGEVQLTAESVGGVLPSLLRLLKIPESSQVLVFSKTSLQHEFIAPRTPRAIYFNDDVYVGFVPGSNTLELSSVDPTIGAVFYTVSQRAEARPSLVTTVRCLQCHVTPATLGVPGHLLRSVFVRSDGGLAAGAPAFLTDHRSPIEERWGGWFVSGTIEGATHMGNALLRGGMDAASFDREPGTRVTDVGAMFESHRYLSPHSDVVALMVIAHQVRMHNLIAKVQRVATSQQASAPGEPRLPRQLADSIEDLVRYMLFADERPLKGPVDGVTTFATEFERLGPGDGKGRSLRQFDLRTRLFRYPCSYLIYSDAFLALPELVKESIYGRLVEILSGRDASPAFANLQQADRIAIADILQATHREFASTIATGAGD